MVDGLKPDRWYNKIRFTVGRIYSKIISRGDAQKFRLPEPVNIFGANH
jgi:hypothetical protein